MMRNLILLVCSVLIVAAWLVEAKPQGCPSCGSSHESLTERCCNDCELCQSSFDVERPIAPPCPNSKNYAYNVDHVRTHCPPESYDVLNAGIEVPPQTGCPKFYNNRFHVNRPHEPPCPEEPEIFDFEIAVPVVEQKCKNLKLTARVDYQPRHCECEPCRYEQYRNSSISSNHLHNRKSLKRTKRAKLKSAIARKFQDNFGFDEKPTVRSLSRKRRKRSSGNGNAICKEGYVCRCVPESERDSLFGKAVITQPTESSEPMVGNIFTGILEEEAVYVGDMSAPSYETIRSHLQNIPKLSSATSTGDTLRELSQIYYEAYKNSKQRNYSVPLKYGTKQVHVDSLGLRTYDIEPVQGVYEPSALNDLASFTNQLYGRFVDRQLARPHPLRKLGLFGGPPKRLRRNSFVQMLNALENDKRRQCSANNRP